MTNRDRIIDTHKKHPHWTAKQIASALGIPRSTVYAAASGAGLRFARKRTSTVRGDPEKLPPGVKGRAVSGTGAVCPECAAPRVAVTDSRPSDALGFHSTRRRRVCLSCGLRYTTYEVSELWMEQQTTALAEAKVARDAYRDMLRMEIEK